MSAGRNFRLTLSFRHVTRERAVATSVLLLAAIAGIASFAMGWGHLIYPTSLTESAVASVGHRSAAIYCSVWLTLAAVLVGMLESSGLYLRRFIRSAAVAAGALAAYALYDLSSERSRAIDALITNTANAAHTPVQLMHEIVTREVAAGIVRFWFAPGIYVAFVAAGLGFLGAYLGSRALAREADVVLRPKAAWDPERQPLWQAPL